MRVLTVFGTRPEAIKMAPVVLELQRNSDFECVLCVTGQHREMLDQVLEAFDLHPNYDLSIMAERQTLNHIVSKTLLGIQPVMSETKPDLVLVHGDTTSSMASALAAFHSMIPVGHVEAGLRTYDRYSPFPEEMNRKLISALATYHFAPTEANQHALEIEKTDGQIWVTGNTVLDSFQYTLNPNHFFAVKELREHDFSQPTILITAHRRENLGQPLENICKAILKLCDLHPEVKVIYPVHLNPAVRETVFPLLGNHEQITLIDPIGILDMHNLMNRCTFVMTDSGGLQEEAPFLNKPVLVLRRETEREEVIQTGAAILAGTEADNIVREALKILEDPSWYEKIAQAKCPYGDGHAAERIVHALRSIRN